VLGALGLTLIGSQVVDRAQTAIVVTNVVVFAIFIAVTIVEVDWSFLSFSGYPPFSDVVASVALTFFAFLGFSVITFSAGDLADPVRGLPIAMYTALGVTGCLYVLISIGVFGTLPVDEVIAHGETAIAEAARPSLGDFGFAMMAVAAVLATASSTNATLYASGALTRSLAEIGQFPPVFGRVGLPVTAGLVLVVANLVDLSAIASVGSAIALTVFVLVGLAGWRRRADTGANAVIAVAAIGVSVIVLAFFAVDTLRTDPATFVATLAIAVLAIALDFIWKRHSGMRRLTDERHEVRAGSVL
jgi:amino acid transporter